MAKRIHYFSYGSNMSIRRLLARVPSAIKVGTGVPGRHELKFHKIGSRDGTGKCDIMETGNAEHFVSGVLFHIEPQEKTELDRIEGLGCGLEHKTVAIRLVDGHVIEAFSYCATFIDPTLKPLDWYREHVLIGARENALPEAYVRAIEVIEDSDSIRRDRELSVYR